ncbi:hypothetical protein N7462_000636 [Penicillium macrosclerotiorum]|uniref:uncharacterized protein n=1 Tax=Penicillium macrosclerotiorum TaxID=303699 RepID=UPI002548AC59|nr:uncharacterized protein N7462_000636 [Penicillium macrosclerotiorum]KAJ5698631.1 hypothetical protein N7462_000636 [Penicillium macrosclerotiorum]
MFSLGELLAGRDLLNKKIEEHALLVANREPLSPAEQAESDAAREEVLSSLERNIEVLKGALHRSEQEGQQINDGLLGSHHAAINEEQIAAKPMDPVTSLVAGFFGAQDSRLKAQAIMVGNMADSIDESISRFRAIQDNPRLKCYNATLNKVAVVGIRENNIWYIKTSTNASNSSSSDASSVIQTVDEWAIFGPMPEETQLAGSKATHLFPYCGDLCLAVGTGIWRKRHRDANDSRITEAMNNWPVLYEDGWEKVGDRCLPDANLSSIIPYATLAATGNKINFHLVTLSRDNTISFLSGDWLTDNMHFQPMKNESLDGEGQAVRWKKIAYWNDRVVGLDMDNHTWNLTMNFDRGVFQAAEKFKIDGFSELTATDIGPVGIGADGYLYRRVFDLVGNQQETKKSTTRWSRWIEQKGVMNIGVASPGVMLDLYHLSESLRTRYFETLEHLYPSVEKLGVFTITHNVFIHQLREAAREYNSVYSDSGKTDISVKEAKKFIKHARIWAQILKVHANHFRESILHTQKYSASVQRDLAAQITVLLNQLTSVKCQLESLRTDFNKINRQFWSAFAAAVVGLTIVLGCTDVDLAACNATGALFIGGLASACTIGAEPEKIHDSVQAAIAESQQLQTAIDGISFAVESIQQIEVLASAMNTFWSSMLDNVSPLRVMDNATAKMLGEQALDEANIENASQTIEQLNKSYRRCQNVLDRCGVRPPGDFDEDSS